MTYTTTQFQIGPEFTPSIIKRLIVATLSLSLIGAFINPIFPYFFGIPGPESWFSLSFWGMQRYMWWQPVTYLFMHTTDYGGMSLNYLIRLAFNMYLLWVCGSELYYRVGSRSLFKFYLFSGALPGLLALVTMPLTGYYPIISGASPAILALVVVWTMMDPEREILLFFLIPAKVKWITLGVISAIILINLSTFNLVNFILYVSAFFIGYSYGIVAWRLLSPFPQTYKFDLFLIRTSDKFTKTFVSPIQSKKKKKKAKSKDSKPTIIDISSHQKSTSNMEDDEFIDAMLEKISKKGQGSLSWNEKERMRKISIKKQKNQ